VRKRHQHNPEFGHKWGEIQKKLAKSTLAIKGVGGETSLSFFLSAFTATTYIFLAPTYTATIITLEPCALNVKFQHFILKATLDKGPGTKSSGINLKQMFPSIGPFFTLQKHFFS
jgi:hypothetical protein